MLTKNKRKFEGFRFEKPKFRYRQTVGNFSDL